MHNTFYFILLFLLALHLGCTKNASSGTAEKATAQSAESNTQPIPHAKSSSQQPITANTPWPRSSPAAQNMDSTNLHSLHSFFKDGDYGYIDHLLVIRNGHIVYDKKYKHNYASLNAGREGVPHPYNYYNSNFFPFYKETELHTTHSITQSITALLIGIAKQNGVSFDLSKKVLSYFKKNTVLNVDSNKEAMTIEDVLKMKSGLEWDEWTALYNDPKNEAAKMEHSNNWLQYVINKPMVYTPGKKFVFNSGSAILLAHIFHQETGMHVDEYAAKYLFAPLGITDYQWKKTPAGLPDASTGCYLSEYDLAKIGYLVLHEGKWEGKQIVDKSYLYNMLTSYIRPLGSASLGYGYQWWVVPNKYYPDQELYMAQGFAGQYLLLDKTNDIVTVFTGWNIYQYPVLSPLMYFDFVTTSLK